LDTRLSTRLALALEPVGAFCHSTDSPILGALRGTPWRTGRSECLWLIAHG
jgi:hypothetical protein